MLGIRRMDRVPDARITELCGVAKVVGERIGHIERLRNGRIAKRVYVRECVGSRLVGR